MTSEASEIVLSTQDLREVTAFAAWCAEVVLEIFEADQPHDSTSNDITARSAVGRLTVVDLDSKLRPVAEALLTQGEQLRGVCVATQVGMFKGRQVLLGVTDGRLLVQGMNRKFEPIGDAISLPPERIADASAEGAGGGWVNVGLAIMDSAAVTLKVRTTDGEKLKLTMMRGTGVFGKLGGGDTQRHGLEAVAAWFTEHAR